MKFQNKQTQYQSKNNPFPTYLNSYVRDGGITIGKNKEFLEIEYYFCHKVDQIILVDKVEQYIKKEAIINVNKRSF
jgi:hypothetical protein